MKIQNISFSLLLVGVFSCALSQSALAGSGPAPDPEANRYKYAPNYFAYDKATGRRVSSTTPLPSSSASRIAGPAVKSSMSSMTRDFLSNSATAPVASSSVSSKVNVPQAFSNILNPGNKPAALVAASAPAGAFGSPIAQKLEPMKAVSRSVKLAGTPKLLNSRPSQAAHRPTTVIASSAQPFRVPTIKHVTTGYSAEQHLPTAVGSGASTSAEVRGVLVPKR